MDPWGGYCASGCKAAGPTLSHCAYPARPLFPSFQSQKSSPRALQRTVRFMHLVPRGSGVPQAYPEERVGLFVRKRGVGGGGVRHGGVGGAAGALGCGSGRVL